MPSLCGSAEATREWFRAFAAHSFLTCRPLRPRRVRHRYFPELRCRHWPSPNDHRLGTPNTPAIRSTRAVDFVASLVRFRYSLPGCLPPCTDQTGILPQPPGTFTSRLSTDRSSSPLLDITTTATELLCWRDSHPLEWQLASLHGHSRPRWSRPRLVHVRFASDSDRQPSKGDPALRANSGSQKLAGQDPSRRKARAPFEQTST